MTLLLIPCRLGDNEWCTMTKHELYVELCKSVLDKKSSETDALACMIILHTYCFQKKQSIAVDDAGEQGQAGKVCVLMAITRRDAAEVISEVMTDYGKNLTDGYLYHEYGVRTPFESVDDISGDWLALTETMVEKMKGTLVDDLWPED